MLWYGLVYFWPIIVAEWFFNIYTEKVKNLKVNHISGRPLRVSDPYLRFFTGVSSPKFKNAFPTSTPIWFQAPTIGLPYTQMDDGKKKEKQRRQKRMKVGQQEVGVYPVWIGFLLLVIIEALVLGL